jgi:hypothetical protein
MAFDKWYKKIISPKTNLKAKTKCLSEKVELTIEPTEDADVSLRVFIIIPWCRPMKSRQSPIPTASVLQDTKGPEKQVVRYRPTPMESAGTSPIGDLPDIYV